MRVTDEIRTQIEGAFRVRELHVKDDSEAHRGHSGWREGGETHFNLRLRAPELAAMGRVQRHRTVHAALGPDLLGRIHALSLDLDG